MTNSEAIIEDLRPYPIRVSLVERKCIRYDLEPTAEVSDEKLIAKIVIEILVQMITMNNVSEGGVSISFDKDKVDEYITYLCSQNGYDSSEFIKQPSVEYLEDM